MLGPTPHSEAGPGRRGRGAGEGVCGLGREDLLSDPRSPLTNAGISLPRERARQPLSHPRLCRLRVSISMISFDFLCISFPTFKILILGGTAEVEPEARGLQQKTEVTTGLRTSPDLK